MGGSTKGLFELLQRHPLALSAAPARQLPCASGQIEAPDGTFGGLLPGAASMLTGEVRQGRTGASWRLYKYIIPL